MKEVLVGADTITRHSIPIPQSGRCSDSPSPLPAVPPLSHCTGGSGLFAGAYSNPGQKYEEFFYRWLPVDNI